MQIVASGPDSACDEVKSGFIKILYNLLIENNSDISMCGVCETKKDEDGKSLTVYYPHAIARATYTITKNLDNKTSNGSND